jgi:polyphosphate kinase
MDPVLPVDEPPDLFNREYSWLDFNERVLAQVTDLGHPLLERAKFLAITASNLDEFFQVRVAALKDRADAGVSSLSPDGRTAAQQLVEIEDRARAFASDQERLWGDLRPELATAGIVVSDWDELADDDRKQLAGWFDTHVFPVLTPLAVDRAHPFPYLSNLSRNLAVLVEDPESGEQRFARVKIPPRSPRFVAAPSGRLVPIEQIMVAQIGELFPGMTVVGSWSFRVTRSADVDVINDDADDLLAAVELELRMRRFGRAVRLEIDATMPLSARAVLLDELDLTEDDVIEHYCMLDFTGLYELARIDRPALRYEPSLPVVPWHFGSAEEPSDVFRSMRASELLVHHPYESFPATVEEFVRQAADDPAVQSIKMTLYRTSPDSGIVRSLTRAAERGVQVAVLIELKARFDEEANITWAKKLERAGVHVVYGLPGLKTHAKCIVVVREEGDGLRRYVHVGTGNYNSRTAGTYEDFGLFSADPVLGDDIGQLFNHLTGFSRMPDFGRIIDAPTRVRDRLIALIANEARHGSDGWVALKCNAVTDPQMIEALYSASRQGVAIDLITRGICCLVPGVPGRSANIRVRSVVGRFLEHSRVYRFKHGTESGEPLRLIGSADLMARNLDHRVEILVPVEQPDLAERLDAVLDASLTDTDRSWVLDSTGAWRRLSPGSADAQTTCAALSRPRARWSAP